MPAPCQAILHLHASPEVLPRTAIGPEVALVLLGFTITKLGFKGYFPTSHHRDIAFGNCGVEVESATSLHARVMVTTGILELYTVQYG